QIGAPQMPDLPRSARLAAAAEAKANRPAQAEMEAALPAWQAGPEVDRAYLQLIEQLRAAVLRYPAEQQGWEYLVQHETALGNLAAAWRAQEKLLELRQAEGQAPNAEELALQGALMTEAAGGRISPEAETVFTR